MLNYKKDRLDYGSLLMPPDGYRLSKAVATTYSLDLQTLLAFPIALFYSKTLEGDFEQNRLDVLDAIQKLDDTFKVYCQKGKIHIPSKNSYLFTFLEKSIAQVIPQNEYSSFHPKLWLLKFENDKNNFQYQLLITSRNMTFDRSWDLAILLFGEKSNVVQPGNEPLIKMLQELTKVEDFKDSQSFINDLQYTAFDCPDGFSSFQFHPIGFSTNGNRILNPLASYKFDELLIMSPFLDNGTLNKLVNNSATKTIFSRKEELNKIDRNILKNYRSFYLSDLITEKENSDNFSENNIVASPQNLHAKYYVGSKGNMHTWLIGSANYTAPAFERNYEFLLELNSSLQNVSFRSILNELIGPDALQVFDEYKYDNIEKAVDDNSLNFDFRELEYKIINSSITGGSVLNSNNQNFDLLFNIDFSAFSWPDNLKILCKPFTEGVLPSECHSHINNSFEFLNIKETALTNFIHFIFKIEDITIRSFLVKADVNLPVTRTSKIIKSIIDNQDKFFQYIKFLLSDNPFEDDLYIKERHSRNNTSPENQQSFFLDSLPIYEQLLFSASSNPKKLFSIDKMINRLKDEKDDDGNKLVPDDFLLLWETFQKTIIQKK